METFEEKGSQMKSSDEAPKSSNIKMSEVQEDVKPVIMTGSNRVIKSMFKLDPEKLKKFGLDSKILFNALNSKKKESENGQPKPISVVPPVIATVTPDDTRQQPPTARGRKKFFKPVLQIPATKIIKAPPVESLATKPPEMTVQHQQPFIEEEIESTPTVNAAVINVKLTPRPVSAAPMIITQVPSSGRPPSPQPPLKKENAPPKIEIMSDVTISHPHVQTMREKLRNKLITKSINKAATAVSPSSPMSTETIQPPHIPATKQKSNIVLVKNIQQLPPTNKTEIMIPQSQMPTSYMPQKIITSQMKLIRVRSLNNSTIVIRPPNSSAPRFINAASFYQHAADYQQTRATFSGQIQRLPPPQSSNPVRYINSDVPVESASSKMPPQYHQLYNQVRMRQNLPQFSNQYDGNLDRTYHQNNSSYVVREMIEPPVYMSSHPSKQYHIIDRPTQERMTYARRPITVSLKHSPMNHHPQTSPTNQVVQQTYNSYPQQFSPPSMGPIACSTPVVTKLENAAATYSYPQSYNRRVTSLETSLGKIVELVNEKDGTSMNLSQTSVTTKETADQSAAETRLSNLEKQIETIFSLLTKKPNQEDNNSSKLQEKETEIEEKRDVETVTSVAENIDIKKEKVEQIDAITFLTQQHQMQVAKRKRVRTIPAIKMKPRRMMQRVITKPSADTVVISQPSSVIPDKMEEESTTPNITADQDEDEVSTEAHTIYEIMEIETATNTSCGSASELEKSVTESIHCKQEITSANESSFEMLSQLESVATEERPPSKDLGTEETNTDQNYYQLNECDDQMPPESPSNLECESSMMMEEDAPIIAESIASDYPDPPSSLECEPSSIVEDNTLIIAEPVDAGSSPGPPSSPECESSLIIDEDTPIIFQSNASEYLDPPSSPECKPLIIDEDTPIIVESNASENLDPPSSLECEPSSIVEDNTLIIAEPVDAGSSPDPPSSPVCKPLIIDDNNPIVAESTASGSPDPPSSPESDPSLMMEDNNPIIAESVGVSPDPSSAPESDPSLMMEENNPIIAESAGSSDPQSLSELSPVIADGNTTIIFENEDTLVIDIPQESEFPTLKVNTSEKVETEGLSNKDSSTAIDSEISEAVEQSTINMEIPVIDNEGPQKRKKRGKPRKSKNEKETNANKETLCQSVPVTPSKVKSTRRKSTRLMTLERIPEEVKNESTTRKRKASKITEYFSTSSSEAKIQKLEPVIDTLNESKPTKAIKPIKKKTNRRSRSKTSFDELIQQETNLSIEQNSFPSAGKADSLLNETTTDSCDFDVGREEEVSCAENCDSSVVEGSKLEAEVDEDDLPLALHSRPEKISPNVPHRKDDDDGDDFVPTVAKRERKSRRRLIESGSTSREASASRKPGKRTGGSKSKKTAPARSSEEFLGFEDTGVKEPTVDAREFFQEDKKTPKKRTRKKKSIEKIDQPPPPTPDVVSNRKNVVCGNCKIEVEKRSWNKHILTHNGLGWIDGVDKSLELREENERYVLNYLINWMKSNKISSLKCLECNTLRRSALGYLSHLKVCGKPPDVEKISCEHCGAQFLKISQVTHMRNYCPVLKEQRRLEIEQSKKNLFNQIIGEEDEGDENPISGRKKRKAVKKAEQLLKSFINAVDVDEFYSDVKPVRISGGTTKRFRNQIEKTGCAKCVFTKCEYTSTNVDEITHHVRNCDKSPPSGLFCRSCDFRTDSKADIEKHILEKHADVLSAAKAMECSESEASAGEESSASDGSSGCEEVEEKHLINEDDDDLNESDIHCSGPIRIRSWNDHYKSSHNCNQLLEKFTADIRFKTINNNYSRFADTWTRNFRNENYSNDPLFSTLLSQYKTENVNFDDYIPKIETSLSFNVTEALNYCQKYGSSSPPTKWLTLQRFTGDVVNGEPIFFCGGPVIAIDWCPFPEYYDGPQYIAVSCMKDAVKDVMLKDQSTMKCLVQIWEVNFKFDMSAKFVYSIPIEFGPVWCLKFCPSGGYIEGKRLGLLAVSTCSSEVSIYAVPLRGPQKIILTPTVRLQLNSINKHNKDSRVINNLSWTKAKGHSIFAAALTNGCIALWDLETASSLLRREVDNEILVLPMTTFFPFTGHITSLEIFYALNSKWIMVTSNRYAKVFELNVYNHPMEVSKLMVLSYITCGVWPIHWASFLFGKDESLLIARNGVTGLQPLGIGFKHYPIHAIDDTIMDIGYSEWSNMFLAPTQSGDIFGCFFRDLLCNISRQDIRKLKLIFGFTDAVKLENDNSTESNSNNFINYPSSRGILFSDMKKPFISTYNAKIIKAHRRAPLDEYPLTKITKISFNPNEKYHRYHAMGYQAGFVRIRKLQPIKV